MSRIIFNEDGDEDFPNQCRLWEANMNRSLKGRAGQAALRELEVALLAMPEKKLIANELQNAEGAVCSIGALAKHRGYEGDMTLPKFDPDAEWNPDDETTFFSEIEHEEAVEAAMLKVASDLGVPKLVAIAIIHMNDDGYFGSGATPEERYKRMLHWTRRQLAPAAA